jgi:hypothetical protein
LDSLNSTISCWSYQVIWELPPESQFCSLKRVTSLLKSYLESRKRPREKSLKIFAPVKVQSTKAFKYASVHRPGLLKVEVLRYYDTVSRRAVVIIPRLELETEAVHYDPCEAHRRALILMVQTCKTMKAEQSTSSGRSFWSDQSSLLLTQAILGNELADLKAVTKAWKINMLVCMSSTTKSQIWMVPSMTSAKITGTLTIRTSSNHLWWSRSQSPPHIMRTKRPLESDIHRYVSTKLACMSLA